MFKKKKKKERIYPPEGWKCTILPRVLSFRYLNLDLKVSPRLYDLTMTLPSRRGGWYDRP